MPIPHRKLPYIWSVLMLGVCLGVAVVPGRAQVYLFGRNDFGDGGVGSGMAAGDFNGDGRTDFAVTFAPSTGAGYVRIFLGQPDGTLAPGPGQGYATGTTPNSVTAGDFNGDGKLDIAVANSGDNTISVYLGNGDGTFSGPTTFPTGATPWWIITEDFNGDGKLDLATSGGSGSTISVLLGNGDGTFQPHVESATLPYPISLAAGDFNGDSKLDLVVGAANAFCILMGKGDGTFQPPAQIASVTGAFFAVGDYNGDHVLDIASLDLNGAGVTIYLGKGDGTFQAGAQYGSPEEFSFSIVAGDFNHDGKLDLAFTNYSESAAGGTLSGVGTNNTVSVLLGNGDGTFGTRTDYGTGPGPTSIVATDANGDGHLDLVTADSLLKGGGQSPTVSVLLGRGDGTFSEAHKDYSTATSVPTLYNLTVFSGDFNGDGKLDLGEILLDSSTNNIQTAIALSKGDGTFESAKYTPFGTYFTDVIYGPLTGDFNNDGKLDFAIVVLPSSTYQLLVFLGNGDGTFQAPISTPLSGYFFAVGDFNGDGKLDVAYTLPGVNKVGVLLGQGNGSFGPETDFATGTTPYPVIAADLNNDGKLDLVVGLTWPTGPALSILLGQGDGTFPTHSDIGQGLASALAVGDLNGDGKLDLVLPYQVMLGNGDGTFQNAQAYDSPLSVAQIIVADMNDDGKMDIVTADSSDTTFSVRYGNGDGTFSRAVAYRDPGLGSVVIGDFNGDGAQDVAVPSSAAAAPAISVYLNTPTVALYPASLNFGSLNLGLSSPAQDVTLSNPGSMPLAITGIAAGGDFSIANSCGDALAAPANCKVSVSFSPMSDGVRNNSLQVTDNAPGSPQIVPLIGTGVGTTPRVTGLPSSLTFTGQLVGSTSSVQTVTLTNSGNGALTIATIAASGDFGETNTCGTGVAAGGNCTISVTFNPTAGGSRAGTLTVTDNAPGSPHTVKLTGMGQDFSIGMGAGSSSTASVAPGGMATYTLALSGSGGLNEAISFACTGAPSEATCTVNPTSATPNASGSVSVTVEVTTMAPSLAAPGKRRAPPAPLGGPSGFLPLLKGSPFGGVLLGMLVLLFLRQAWAGRRPWQRRVRFGLVVVTLAMLTVPLGACGGGGGGAGITNPGTPAGTYTVTVTGTLSGSTALQHSTTLTLQVS